MPSKFIPKPCRNCGKEKPKGGGRALCDDCSARCEECDSFNYKCKGCQTRQSVRATRMKEYGLTLPEIIELEKIKGCEVCGSGYRLCVDHDHESGKVRGILCWHCNVALGNVRDRIETLEGLITWLKER